MAVAGVSLVPAAELGSVLGAVVLVNGKLCIIRGEKRVIQEKKNGYKRREAVVRGEKRRGYTRREEVIREEKQLSEKRRLIRE